MICFFITIYKCNYKNMGRNKKDITKDTEFRFRLESKLKGEYLKFCRERKYVLSNRLRELIINDLKK